METKRLGKKIVLILTVLLLAAGGLWLAACQGDTEQPVDPPEGPETPSQPDYSWSEQALVRRTYSGLLKFRERVRYGFQPQQTRKYVLEGLRTDSEAVVTITLTDGDGNALTPDEDGSFTLTKGLSYYCDIVNTSDMAMWYAFRLNTAPMGVIDIPAGQTDVYRVDVEEDTACTLSFGTEDVQIEKIETDRHGRLEPYDLVDFAEGLPSADLLLPKGRYYVTLYNDGDAAVPVTAGMQPIDTARGAASWEVGPQPSYPYAPTPTFLCRYYPQRAGRHILDCPAGTVAAVELFNEDFEPMRVVRDPDDANAYALDLPDTSAYYLAFRLSANGMSDVTMQPPEVWRAPAYQWCVTDDAGTEQWGYCAELARGRTYTVTFYRDGETAGPARFMYGHASAVGMTLKQSSDGTATLTVAPDAPYETVVLDTAAVCFPLYVQPVPPPVGDAGKIRWNNETREVEFLYMPDMIGLRYDMTINGVTLGGMETIAGGEESRYYALSTLPEGVEDMTLTAYAVVLRDGTEIPVDYTLTVCFRRPYA